MEEGLPNFLMVGAQKAGTTSLHYYLSQHPDIYLSEPKELFFFTGVDNQEYPGALLNDERRTYHPIRNINDYRCIFENRRELVRGESSTHYLYCYSKAISNIKKIYGEDCRKIKICILLRDPVSRAFSAWSMLKRDGQEDLSFREALECCNERLLGGKSIDYDYLGFGLYKKQIEAYLENFDEVKVILTEDLEASPEVVLRELCEFLDVKAYNFDASLRLNKSGKPSFKFLYDFLVQENAVKEFFKKFVPLSVRYRLKYPVLELLLDKPVLSPVDEEYLREFYKEDVNGLRTLLARPLKGWCE